MRLNNACCIYALFITDNENLNENLLTGEFFQKAFINNFICALYKCCRRFNKDI